MLVGRYCTGSGKNHGYERSILIHDYLVRVQDHSDYGDEDRMWILPAMLPLLLSEEFDRVLPLGIYLLGIMGRSHRLDLIGLLLSLKPYIRGGSINTRRKQHQEQRQQQRQKQEHT